MQSQKLLLRTDIHDQRVPAWTQRGSRYWVQAELYVEMFFIVEECVVDGPDRHPQRFIAADLSEAHRIPELYGLKKSTLLACVLGLEGQRRLEQVIEAYVGAASDQIAVKLESGEVILAAGSATGQVLSRGSPVFLKEEQSNFEG